MKIGIIGAGNMGAALGKVWSEKGHEVMFSYSRDIEKLNRLASLNQRTTAGSVIEAVMFGEIVLLAVPYISIEDVLHNKSVFNDKIIITCVSGLHPDFSGETIGISTTMSKSVAEQICHLLQTTKVVEAFNTTFAEILKLPASGNEKPSLFYCGDDIEAKRIAAILIEDAGYTPINAGALLTARAMETFATSWVQFTVVAGLFPRIAIHTLQY